MTDQLFAYGDPRYDDEENKVVLELHTNIVALMGRLEEDVLRQGLIELGWTPPPEPGKEKKMDNLVRIDNIKMLRESLCRGQDALTINWSEDCSRHSARIQQLIDQLDILRPLGPDGKHGDRHTPYCGCDDQKSKKAICFGCGSIIYIQPDNTIGWHLSAGTSSPCKLSNALVSM